MTTKKKAVAGTAASVAAEGSESGAASSATKARSLPKAVKPARTRNEPDNKTRNKAAIKTAKSADKSMGAPAALAKSSGKTPKNTAAAKSVKPSKTPDAPKNAAKKIKAVSKPRDASKVKTSAGLNADTNETEQVLDSQVVYEGKLFRVFHDRVIEPGGRESHRDVIRHNGSVVILAVDPAKRKKDPWIVIERQYRHAAGQFLWELPAGKLDAGEALLDGAKRELAEETGYQAKKWTPLFQYFASPGFLGESMNVFLAEGLVAGDAHPEDDELIDFRLVKLSDLLDMIDKGKIIDGKTLTTILLYARLLGLKRKK